MKYTNSKTVLSIVFATSLVVANLVATKLAFFQIPYLGGVAVPAGFAAIGVSFLCTDLLGDLHGRDEARRVVNATVVALGVAWVLVYTAIWFPTAPFYQHGQAFNTIFGASGTIVTAGILTTLVSQNIDVSVFHRLRTYTGGRHKWLRNLGSTGVSQLVDTTLFIVLGFAILPRLMGGTITPLVAIPGLILGQYVVKLVVAGLDTPLFYLLSRRSETENQQSSVNVE
jgi:uncharacterized integral membrane protein (TIGR00697 family)